MTTNFTPPNFQNMFEEMTKLAQRYNLSSGMLESTIQSRRKDWEAMVEAGRALGTGAQTIAQKQAEMLRSSFQELQGALSQSPDASRTDSARQAAQRALDGLADMAQASLQAQSDAFDVVRRRTQENIEELRTLLSSASSKPSSGKN